MSKKKPSSTSAGNTVNPAAQPSGQAAGVSSSGFGVSGEQPGTHNAKRETPAPSGRAKAKRTVGPDATVAEFTDAPEADAAAFEQEAHSFLAEAINIGSDADELPAKGKTKAADRTPARKVPKAQEQFNQTGDDGAGTEGDGAPEEEENSGREAEAQTRGRGDAETRSEAEGESESESEAESEAEAEGDEAVADSPDDGPTDDEADDEDDAQAADADANARRWPKSFLKKLARKDGKIEKLEDALEAAQREITELREAQPVNGQASNGMAVTTEEQKWQREIERCEETLDWIDEHPEGAQTPDGKEWSREQLRRERRTYERSLRDAEDNLRASKRKRSERTEALQGQLLERHPWMKDRTHPARARVEEIVRQYPAFRDIPEARIMIADHLAYQDLRERAAAAARNGNGNGQHSDAGTRRRGDAGNGANGTVRRDAGSTVAARPAPRPPSARGPGRPGAAPMAINGQRASLARAEQTFLETGDPEAGKALVSSLLDGL